jgi:hypothetical protein
MTDAPQKCCASIYDSLAWRSRSCERNAKIERDGKWYCKQHDPVAKAEKHAERTARWDHESEERRRRYRLESAALEMLRVLKAYFEDRPADWEEQAKAAITKAEGG